MIFRNILAAVALVGLSSAALAETSGTKEQQDACRPDVRKFCHTLKESDGNDAFLKCLQANRAKLSKPCRTLLESNGQ
jgi:hypothetical protein